MDTKNKSKEKGICIIGGILGICIVVVSLLYFIHMAKMETEERLLEIVNYVKVQCSTYTHYNESSESKSLLRAIESARQMSTNIATETQDGDPLAVEFLKENLQTLWVDGIFVMDEDGRIACEYSMNANLRDKIIGYLQKDVIMDFAEYTERTYAERISTEDGGNIDIAACARQDQPGIVATYYYTPAEFVRNYTLTIQSLLNGYNTEKDGTILVSDKGTVIASNDESLLGQTTAGNEVVQEMKKHTDSRHIFHLNNEGSRCYGIMLKQRDYYIYAYIPDTEVFRNLLPNVMIVAFTCLFILSFVWLLLHRTNLAYQRQEQEKEERYKEKILKAAKQAEAANAAKTEFLQRMSHDIRTPINGICGMLEVADHYSEDMDKQTECRTKIKEASAMLLELVNEVLDMSKLESGEVILEEIPFNIDTTCEEVLLVISQMAEERNIRIIREGKEVTHWNLIGSPVHVKRILMNILINAVKYNKDNGSIYIGVREIPSEISGKTVMEFTCRDTGRGMSKEFQKRIFEPFAQEHTGSRTKYSGTGLGMPIVKNLVEKMGGTIRFESEEGTGSTFVIRLPFCIDTERKKVSKEEKPEVSIQGLHILLAEDNELNMEIAEFIVENEGAVPAKAENGEEAVELFRKSAVGTYDVILMDIMMPVMDGLTAARKIRAMDRLDAKTIPIIAMTANAFTEDKLKTKEAGMNEHMSKPLNREQLVETIARLMQEADDAMYEDNRKQKRTDNFDKREESL